MAHSIRTKVDIEGMRVAGKLAAECSLMIEEYVKPGVTTGELDRICHGYIVDVQRAIPVLLNYRGFPKSICTSINHVVCHGIPDYEKELKRGDIINIDVTVIKDGYHGDTSKMYTVGKANLAGQVNPDHPRMYTEVSSSLSLAADLVILALPSKPMQRETVSLWLKILRPRHR